jgi:REP element-mobilizing transposase RayT
MFRQRHHVTISLPFTITGIIMPHTNPHRAGRRSVRLPEFDYSAGVFFITVNKSDDVPSFGTISEGIIVPSAIGEIVTDEWYRSAEVRDDIKLDAFALMPDHLHGIVLIDPALRSTEGYGRRQSADARQYGPISRSLGAFIGGFKSAVTSRAIRDGLTDRSIWQRSYYDRIVRNRKALEAVRRYIEQNPANWPKRHRR